MNLIENQKKSHQLWSALHIYEDMFGPGLVTDVRRRWSEDDPEYQALCNAIYIVGPISTSMLLELYSRHPRAFLRVACGDSTVDLPAGFQAWGVEKGDRNAC